MKKADKAKLLELVEYLDTCAWMLERAYTYQGNNPKLTKLERVSLWNRERAKTLAEAKALIN